MENSKEQENEGSEENDFLKVKSEKGKVKAHPIKIKKLKTPGHGYTEHTKPDAERGIGVLHPIHYSAVRGLSF